MSVTIRKLAVSDITTIQTLVVEHAEDLESGLAVLDSRLLVGQATIDVVACDANATLVLMVVGRVADEDMLLRAVDAYSWCLEYPDTVRRLYPAALVSTERPPRMLFVVERVPDAFHRKVKQLGFSDAAVVEARFFDVDGTPAAFFDVVARLRRGVPPAPAVVPAAATTTLVATPADVPAPRRAPDAGPTPLAPNVIPLNGAARGAGAKPQRVAGRSVVETLATTNAPPPQGDPSASVAATASAPAGEATPGTQSTPEADLVAAAVMTVAEPVTSPTPESASMPAPVTDPTTVPDVVATALLDPAGAPEAAVTAPVAGESKPESRVSFAGVASELLGAPTPQSQREDSAGGTAMPYPIDEDPQAAIEELLDAKPGLETSSVAAPATSPKPVGPPVWAAVKPTPATPAMIPTSKPATEPKIAIKPVTPAKATAAAPLPRLGAASATAAAPLTAPAPSAPAAASGAAAAAPEGDRKAAATLPPEIAGLQFPNDGQLTRQWLEFLSQMAASK